jgi:hypothetical protein
MNGNIRSLSLLFAMGKHAEYDIIEALIGNKATINIYKLLDARYPITDVKDISKLVDVLNLKTDLDKIMFYTKYKQNLKFAENIILSNMGMPPVLSLKLLTYCKVAQLYGNVNTLVDNRVLPPIYWTK